MSRIFSFFSFLDFTPVDTVALFVCPVDDDCHELNECVVRKGEEQECDVHLSESRVHSLSFLMIPFVRDEEVVSDSCSCSELSLTPTFVSLSIYLPVIMCLSINE